MSTTEFLTNYRAIDGRSIDIPPPPELPDERGDFERFRKAARTTAIKAAETAFDGVIQSVEHEINNLDNPYLDDPEVLKRQKSKAFVRILDALVMARKHRIATAESRADGLIDALQGDEGGRQFASRIAGVLGRAFARLSPQASTAPGNAYAWAYELFHALPPKAMAEALSTLVGIELTDPYSTDIFRNALMNFLSGPYGDLRHLEGDAPWEPEYWQTDYSHPPKDWGVVAASISEQLGAKFLPQDLELARSIDAQIRECVPEHGRREPLKKGAFMNWFMIAAADTTSLLEAPPVTLWRYFASQTDLLDMAFGLRPTPGRAKFQTNKAIRALRYLPATPARYEEAVGKIALGGKKKGRRDAQRLLRGAESLLPMIKAASKKKKTDLRMQAVICLGETKLESARTLLAGMLEREDDLALTNAILKSLASMGHDISAHAPSQDDLVIEAQGGLDESLTEKRRWLAHIEAPDLAFGDGTPAPLEVGPWLIRFAANLGEPAGGPLIDARLELLGAPSREALGRAVLEGWVREDTWRWDEIAFETHRPIFEREMYSVYARLVDLFGAKDPKISPFLKSNKGRRLSQADYAAQIDQPQIDAFLHDKLNWGVYLFSAYEGKGSLALARYAPTQEVIKTIRVYHAKHGRRMHQAKVLVDLLASLRGEQARQALRDIAATEKRKGLRSYAIETLEDLGETPPLDHAQTALSESSD